MKIAIVGTRGIPNNYGGFEQLAQYLSLGLKTKGHEVYVYNSHKHPYQEDMWEGIHIIHKYDPEKRIGTVGQFVYDLKCILNTRKHGFDIILNLGYTSSSVWMRLFPEKALVITNMDGLEWKRSKYSRKVQAFLRFAEALAVKRSDRLVADSRAIQTYLRKKYNKESEFIAYGADVFSNPEQSVLEGFKVAPYSYNMLIARMEPENNIEMILDGMSESSTHFPFFVVGNTENKFGRYLLEKYKADKRIVFTGPIYEMRQVNNLRYFSNLYFHGHSVGGTNPSLLEAMGCNCLVAAHDNEFNKGVLDSDAFYFGNKTDITRLLDSKTLTEEKRKAFTSHNIEKIRNSYSWARIAEQYEQLMLKG